MATTASTSLPKYLFGSIFTLYLPCTASPAVNDQQGPWLSGLIHEEAHPVAPYLKHLFVIVSNILAVMFTESCFNCFSPKKIGAMVTSLCPLYMAMSLLSAVIATPHWYLAHN